MRYVNKGQTTNKRGKGMMRKNGKKEKNNCKQLKEISKK